MVQIGNMHIGSSESAIKPKITFGEANIVWENLKGRYDLLETIQFMYNYAHDEDLQNFIKKKVIAVMLPQIESLENILLKYQLPLPQRPPKDVSFQADVGVITDEYIFRRTFSSLQDFLSVCAEAIKISVFNDELRETFYDYLMEKIETFDFACELGIKKGWLELPPMIK